MTSIASMRTSTSRRLICSFGLCRVRIFRHRNSAPLYLHMHTREGCSLGPHVLPYIQNALLFQPEWPKNVVSLLLSCSSYTSFNNCPGAWNHICASFPLLHLFTIFTWQFGLFVCRVFVILYRVNLDINPSSKLTACDDIDLPVNLIQDSIYSLSQLNLFVTVSC